jgi:hypothetical protein
MTAILDNFAAKVDLTAMAQARDAEFAEMLDEYRAAGEMYVYEGSFAVAWEAYGGQDLGRDLYPASAPGGMGTVRGALSGSRFKGSLPSVSRGHCLRATPPMLHRPE